MKVSEFKEKFRTQPHKLKGFFDDNFITSTELANYLNSDSWTTGRYLSGKLKVPPEIETKLQELAEELKEG